MQNKETPEDSRMHVSSPETLLPYGTDGVDVSLIRWMLSMTPTERLQTLQRSVRSIVRLRDAAAHS